MSKLRVSCFAPGSGEPLLSGLDLPARRFRVVEHVASEAATHVVLTRGPEVEHG